MGGCACALLVAWGGVNVRPVIVREEPYGRSLARGREAQGALGILPDEALEEQPFGRVPTDALPMDVTRLVDGATRELEGRLVYERFVEECLTDYVVARLFASRMYLRGKRGRQGVGVYGPRGRQRRPGGYGGYDHRKHKRHDDASHNGSPFLVEGFIS